jgi:type IV fimbrial biogenesis protein FimT
MTIEIRQGMEETPMKLYFDRCAPRIGQRSGYTAIELVVVIALVAIMIAMALPHFSSMADRWRVHQAITQLQNVLRFASVQAIRTGSSVEIRATPVNCRPLRKQTNAQDWSCGLTVSLQDAGQPPLQEVPEFYAVTVMHGGFSTPTKLTYSPYGVPTAANGSFEVFPAMSPDSPAARTICLSRGGQMRVQAGLKCSS